MLLTAKGLANPWCHQYAYILIKYTGQMARLCAEQTPGWQGSKELFDATLHYFFSCSSCCCLSYIRSSSQAVSRGNLWYAEKELTQQHLSPSASWGQVPSFFCSVSENGDTGGLPAELGMSSASTCLTSERLLPTAVEDAGITSTLILFYFILFSQRLYSLSTGLQVATEAAFPVVTFPQGKNCSTCSVSCSAALPPSTKRETFFFSFLFPVVFKEHPLLKG